ncbi:MAG: caspase family protein [Candidatus Binataceae bacterium]
MTRGALIIINPGLPDEENYCAGVYRDAANYRGFMQAPYGGSWDKDEIRIREQPSPRCVRQDIAWLSGCDYAIVVFSGHGFHSINRNTTVVELKHGVQLDSEELIPGSKKQVLILDCCRVPVQEPLTEELAKSFNKLSVSSLLDTDECRRYFDKWIESCPDELVIMYACSVGERAGDDDERGGFYSDAILTTSELWAANKSADPSRDPYEYYIFTVGQAHEAAKPIVKRRRRNLQNPHIEKPRSGRSFALGIVA